MNDKYTIGKINQLTDYPADVPLPNLVQNITPPPIPTETVEGWRERLDQKWPPFEVEGDHQQFSEGIFVSDVDVLKSFIQSELDLALTKERARVNEVLEGMRKTEKTVHTPNCQRGTCKNNHFFCNLSDEDDGYNEALSDAQKRITE